MSSCVSSGFRAEHQGHMSVIRWAAHVSMREALR